MGTYDVVMLLVLLVTAFVGWQKGMAWQIASLASIVVSYFVAMQFRGPVSEHINIAPPLNTFVAMLVLYLGTSVVIWLLFRVIRQTIDHWKLRDFDRQMGALVGVAKGAVLCCIITLFAVTLLGEPQRQTIISSRSGFYIACALERARSIMPDEIHGVLEPYLDRLEHPDHGVHGDPHSPSYELRLDQQPPRQESSYPDYAGPEKLEYLPPDSGTDWPDRRAGAGSDSWR